MCLKVKHQYQFLEKILKKGSQEIFEKDIEYSYEFLIENVENLMNLIDLDVFYDEYINN